jgi:hypothetical protein
LRILDSWLVHSEGRTIPLLDEISINVYRVGLTEVIRNECYDVFKLRLIFEPSELYILEGALRHKTFLRRSMKKKVWEIQQRCRSSLIPWPHQLLMRNRQKVRVDTTVDPNESETAEEHLDHDVVDATHSDNGHDTETSPQRLTTTATREEVTQTNDELAFVRQPPEKQKRPWTQYPRIVFILGCVMGIVLAWVFRAPDLQLEGLLDSVDMADFFDDLKAALPSALPMGLLREAKEIQKHSRQTVGSGAFSIGEQMVQEGMSAHYPVVMVH